MDQILSGLAAILLVCCLLNPDHFPPWTSFHSEAPAFAAGVLLFLATAVRGAVRLTPPTLVLMAVVASAWTQWAFGLVLYSGDAWVVTAYAVVAIGGWVWGASQPSPSQKPSSLDLLIGSLLLMGLLGACQACAEWTQVEDAFGIWVYAPGTTRSTGNLGQPNQLATLLLMATAGVATWMVRGRLGRLAGWSWLLLGGWAVVLTQSRTGLLAAAMMVVGLLVAGVRARALRRWNKDAIAWLLLLLLGAGLLHTMQFDLARPALGLENMASVGLRPVIWRQMLDALSQSPWVGFGWLQVSIAQQAGAVRVPGIEQTNYSHNMALDALVMLGLPLGLLLIGAAVAWISRRVRRLSEDADGTALAALFIVLPWLVHTGLELPHAYSYFLVPVAALLGLIESRTSGVPLRPRTGGMPLSWRTRQKWTALAAGAAILTLFGVLAFEYALVEEDFRVNRFENRRLGTTPPDYIYPRLYLLTQFQDVLRAMRLRAKPGMPAEDVDTLVRAATRYIWAPLEFRAALALGLNDRPEEARRRLQVVTTLFPPDVVEDGRDNWHQAQKQYPVLLSIAYPPAATPSVLPAHAPEAAP